MIAYKDFVPSVVHPPTVFRQAEFARFETAVAAANAWVVREAVDVVSVETVVLPNIWSPMEEGTNDSALYTSNEGCLWYQFVRVWYREEGQDLTAG